MITQEQWDRVQQAAAGVLERHDRQEAVNNAMATAKKETTCCTHEKCSCQSFKRDPVHPVLCLYCVHSCEWHAVPARELF